MGIGSVWCGICIARNVDGEKDDIAGRTRMYEAIVKGENVLDSGRPESFNVLIKELQGLGLNFQVKNEDGDSILTNQSTSRFEGVIIKV